MEIIDDYYLSHEEDTDSEVCSEWSNQNENISLLSIDDVEPTAAPRGRPKKRTASVQDDVHLEFIISKYGNPMVVMEGEIYKFRSKDKNGTTHWGCIKSVEGCKTCLETNSSNQCVGMSEGRHNHCTDKVEIEVRKIKSKVRVDVKDAFDMILRKEVLNPDGTSKFEFGGPEIKFLDYFVKTWIGWTNGRPLFAVKLWNCFELTKEGKSKTTNSIEAWHNSLHYALATQDGKKPKFWKWLRQMKKECSLQEAKLASLRAGKIPKLKTADKKRVNQRMEIAKKYTKEKLFDYVKKLGLVTVLEER